MSDTPNHPAPITRRRLLAGMAALAGAFLARGPVVAAPLAVPLAAPLPPPGPSALDLLAGEVQWAHAELMAAWEAYDFGAWIVDSEDEKPNRLRLARALVLSRELDRSEPLAVTVNGELESLWAALTRPRVSTFRRCYGVQDRRRSRRGKRAILPT